jgi:hypothetical protein
VHFLVLGGLIFLVYAYLNDGLTPREEKIVVSKAKIDQLRYVWKKKYLREPTPEELQDLIDAEIYARVMSREAQKLGLDREDEVIRRRLAQKMRFISANLGTLLEPSDEELKAYLEAHPEKFLSPERISFTLKGAGIGEKFHADMSAWDVSRLYGHAFAQKLFTLSEGVWSEGIPMPYGNVDVYVHEKKAARPLPFEQVKGRLKSAWQKHEQEKLERAFYEKAKKGYEIKVEGRP